MAILKQQADLTLPSTPGSAPYRFQSPKQAEEYLYPTAGSEESDESDGGEGDEEGEEYESGEDFEADFEGQTGLDDEGLEELADTGSLEDTEEAIFREEAENENEWRRMILAQRSKISEAINPRDDEGIEKAMGVSSGTLNAFLRINPMHPGNHSFAGMIASFIRVTMACFGATEILQQFQTVFEQAESKTGGQTLPLVPGKNTEEQFDYILIFFTFIVIFLLFLLVALPAFVIFFILLA